MVWTALSVQWPFLVISGGLAFLVAPMVYQALPERFIEGPVGVVLLIAANSSLIWVSAPQSVLSQIL
jgi:hypothetical protein